MQARLRRFVAEFNRRSGATVILTSHYMADVVALCPRVIVIHHGRLIYDGGLSQLAERLVLRGRRSAAAAVTAQLLQRLPVADLTVEDPPLEAVIDQIYQGDLTGLEAPQ
ncbi:MAG: hypothetical protein CVU38_10800 [Chloroflexi bacterium HGW-Chloroflexi-1]|nr:MAG: hypothetical protein CVU38_10800 [Chloroflexi bacterium HGW-Chloroflexi-1]